MYDYRQYLPAAPLADLIECYWVGRSLPAPGEYSIGKDVHWPENHGNRLERLIPGGRVELIFNFSDPLDWLIDRESQKGTSLDRAHIMGQRNQIYFARETGRADMLGIRFKTGGLIAFTQIPVSELLNRLIPAKNVFGPVLTEWESLLYEKGSDRERIQLLDQLLVKEIKPLPREWEGLKMTIKTLKSGAEDSSIEMICHQTGWYYKKLERVFLKAVGYSPKHYSRIIRFNKAIRKMKNGDRSLTEIGYDCGYFDQSHFIRDFHQFAGTSPGHFQAEENNLANMLIRHQAV